MTFMNQESKRENKNSRKKENRENKKVSGLTDHRDKQVGPVPPTRATTGGQHEQCLPSAGQQAAEVSPGSENLYPGVRENRDGGNNRQRGPTNTLLALMMG